MSDAITIIAPTRRPHMIGRLLSNFTRQQGPQQSRLVICLHGVEPLPHDLMHVEGLDNVKFLRFRSDETLGSMLNRGAFEVETKFVCKWDDDDFYGIGFLCESVQALKRGQGRLVGKGGWLAWIERESRLYSRFQDNCHKYSGNLAGGTLACATSDWMQIGFPSVSLGEDQAFVRRFIAQGLPVWATSLQNYVQFRGINTSDHTWNISDENYLVGAHMLSSRLDFALIDKEH